MSKTKRNTLPRVLKHTETIWRLTYRRKFYDRKLRQRARRK